LTTVLTALLLLPVVAILIWLYWYLLPVGNPRKFRWVDLALLSGVIGGALVYQWLIRQRDWRGDGPLWFEIVSLTGTYAILAVGLAGALAWRRRR
jgi:hypothetical protein